MNAIVYTSNAGSAARYAEMLSSETGIHAYSMKEARGKVPAGAEIVYVGWVMANKVQGYSAAEKRYRARAVCAVGMAKTGTNGDSVRAKTRIPDGTQLFTLEGNFSAQKLRGVYRLMMNFALKGLSGKKNRTLEEDEMLAKMRGNADYVKKENLKGVLEWFEGCI